jgi:hypothetical protein
MIHMTKEGIMPKSRPLRIFVFTIVTAALCACQQVPPEIKQVDDIIARNIEAAGGNERLSGIESFSFSFGPTTYTMSASGPMKMTVGKLPVITEAILVNDQGVRRNCFNNLSQFQGLDADVYQVLARLRSGVFSLIHFQGELAYQELKSFGPQQMHRLTTTVGGLQVEFNVDAETYELKRLVLKGYEEAQGSYDVSHDFGPYQEAEGIRLPSSWYSSRVGTRGSEFEVQDVRLNPVLDSGYFENLDINAGDVEINPGELKGHIVEFAFQRGQLTLGTNWTARCVQGAGFEPEDTLVLNIQDRDVELVLYNDRPPQGAMGPGKNVMIPNFRSENYNIYLISEEYQALAETLEVLLPIRLGKK